MPTFEEAQRQVAELVQRFQQNPPTNETSTRVQFINPFFEALGWDVRNVAGHAEQYKDVIHEDAVLVGAATKAPDYCFRIGGVRKFFVEAKKPSVPIKGDPHPAYQLRRYAWSAKFPLSILTDFEELAVYDCTKRPKPTDKAAKARIRYVTCDQYPEAFRKIWDIFAKESVLKGSFDRFTEKARGTAEVDAEFLKEIEAWRSAIARNLALRNKRLPIDELNEAVQKIIDRIIFLRMAEDRGIETQGRLLALVNAPKIYQRFGKLCEQADAKYNSGLFDFAKDTWTLDLKVDDKVLKPILTGIYYPESPYEFSVLPPEILGNVYEQFLGKIIRLTKGHQARVEEKPEVKKAGGVYYTPKYIVDYIVQHTVGELVAGKSPTQLKHFHVLDPACGSGSFLLGAYQQLLDHYLEWYTAHSPARRKKQVYRRTKDEWRLTTAERKRILTAHIHGVDIDPQAVEVTKLSLLLKVLEGESADTLGRQMQLFRERALPNLKNNIKCGNSLIGPDYFEGKLPAAIDAEELRRVNPFDWDAEFPHILGKSVPKPRRGFDAVIGNPPYIRVRSFKKWYPQEAEYLERSYECASHVWDVYLLLYERAVQLLRDGGRCAYIVPVQTLHQPNCESLRRLLFEQTRIDTVTDLSAIKVFSGAIVKNCIIVAEKARRKAGELAVMQPASPDELCVPAGAKWSLEAARKNPGYSLKTDLLSPKKTLCDKLAAESWQLSDLCYVTFGMRSCAKGVGQGGKHRLITTNSKARNAKRYLEGRDIGRYSLSWPRRYIRYIPEEMYSPREPALFETPKIISQTMLSRMRPVGTLDLDGFYVEQSLLCIVPHGILTERPQKLPDFDLKCLLGVLNSTLTTFYFKTLIIDYSLGGGLVHATPGSQGKLLVPRLDVSKNAQRKQHDRIVELVDQMLELHKQLHPAKNDRDKELLQRQIDATDREIDQLVYKLYGLSAKEIRVVEEGIGHQESIR